MHTGLTVKTSKMFAGKKTYSEKLKIEQDLYQVDV